LTIYSYILRFDIGFAPNPFHGCCTLATCKQEIRSKAKIGDWLLGTGSKAKSLDGHLIYAMRVDEIVSYDEYWTDDRFSNKRPDMRASLKRAFGDNIYHHDADGEWIQADSRHSFPDGVPNPGHIRRDTKSDKVLIARQFVYFGDQAPPIPESLRSSYGADIVHDRPFHRCGFPSALVESTICWLETLGTGVRGRPCDWPPR
jgi:hypothetical protein